MNKKTFGIMIGGLVAVIVIAAMVLTTREEGAPDDSAQPPATTAAALTQEAVPITMAEDSFDYGEALIITADKPGDFGIAKDSSFTLTHVADVTAGEVAQTLIIEPNIDVDVTEIGERKFRVTPKKALPEDRTMKFQYSYEGQLYGYAFNTIEPFKVDNVYPATDSEWVDIATGIELTFTRPVDEAILEHIAIEPRTDVTHRIEGNLLILLPTAPLDKETDYTVTVTEGYAYEGEALPGMSFSFTTASPWQASFNFPSKRIQTTTTSGPQTIPVFGNESMEGESFDVRAYRIEGDANPFISQRGHRRILMALGDGKLPEATVFTRATFYHESWEHQYLMLEDVLPRGVYYIAVGSGEEESGTFVQVTDKNAFILIDEDEVVFWATEKDRDDLTGRLYLESEQIGTTDRNGFLQASITPKENALSLFSFDTGDEVLYLPTAIGSADTSASYDYYSYIYPDRGIYKRTDTIEISGYIRNRYGKAVTEVRAELAYDDQVIDSITLPVSPIGSYVGSFDLVDYNVSYVDVNIYVGDDKVDDLWLSIYNFEKPTYQMTSSFDKVFIEQGGTVNYETAITYFNGAPLKDAKVTIDYYDHYEARFEEEGTRLEGGQVTLPEGRLVQPMAIYAESDDWRPKSISILASPLELQGFYSSTYTSIYVFPKDTMVEVTSEAQKDGRMTIEVATHNIDLSGATGSTLPDIDSYRGTPVAGQPLKLTVTESYYDKVVIDQRYDAITKETYEVYDYVYRENKVAEVSLTSDEEGVATFDFDGVLEDRNYDVQVTTTDRRGSTLIENHHFGDYMHYRFNENGPSYALTLEGDGPYNQSSLGSVVTGKVLFSGEAIENKEDKTLFLEIRDGIRRVYLTDDTEIGILFDEKRAPGTQLRAVYFDGTTMVSGSEMERWMRLDWDTRTLKSAIVYDKESYKPGDEVAYEIQVTDDKGNPVKADVNISVVDEAFFAVSEDYREPKAHLLGADYVTNTLGEFTISSELERDHMAEGGEGGDDGYRADFDDTAFFGNVTTDDAGIAVGSFKLSDNVTAWRVTMTAYTEDVRVGKDTATLKASLPLFTKTQIEDSYLTGDDIYVHIRTAGDGVDATEDVTVKVSLDSGKGRKSVLEEVTALGEAIFVPLGQLAEGSHKLYVDVTADGAVDKGLYTFDVVPSRSVFEVKTSESLTKDLTLTHNDSFVKVAVYNKKAYGFYTQLNRLTYGRHGKSYLRQMTADKAASYSADLFGTVYYDDFYSWRYFDEAGLVKPLANANGDMMATARMAGLGVTDRLTPGEKTRTLKAVRGYIEEKHPLSEAYISALWAQALMDRPDFNRLNAVADNYGLIETSKGRLTLIRALIDAGALTKGSVLLDRFLTEEAIDIDGTMVGISPDTALYEGYSTMLLGAFTGLQDWTRAEELFETIQKEPIRRAYEAAEPEMLAYIMAAPKPVLNSVLTLSVEGEEKRVPLDFDDRYEAVLTAEEAASFRVVDFNGDLTIATEYYGEGADILALESLPVKRGYQDMNGGELVVGDLVTITLTFERPDNVHFFHIQDSLPAGMTFFRTDDQMEDLYLWGEARGSVTRLRGYLSTAPDKVPPKEVTVRYVAVASAPGTYGSEPTIISTWADTTWVGDENNVVIGQ